MAWVGQESPLLVLNQVTDTMNLTSLLKSGKSDISTMCRLSLLYQKLMELKYQVSLQRRN